MKLAINTCGGVFAYPEGYCLDFKVGPLDWLLESAAGGYDEHRDPYLIEWLENHPDERGNLTVVRIPDDCTDYKIRNFGKEFVEFVRDGRIFTRWG